MNGKGDAYRRVDPAKWSENYDRIFRKTFEGVCSVCGKRYKSDRKAEDGFVCTCQGIKTNRKG